MIYRFFMGFIVEPGVYKGSQLLATQFMPAASLARLLFSRSARASKPPSNAATDATQPKRNKPRKIKPQNFINSMKTVFVRFFTGVPYVKC